MFKTDTMASQEPVLPKSAHELRLHTMKGLYRLGSVFQEVNRPIEAETHDPAVFAVGIGLVLPNTTFQSLQDAYSGCEILSDRSLSQTPGPTYLGNVASGTVITVCPFEGGDLSSGPKEDFAVSVMVSENKLPTMAAVAVRSAELKEEFGPSDWFIAGGPDFTIRINAKNHPELPQADCGSWPIHLAYTLGRETTPEMKDTFLAVKRITGFEITQSECAAVPLILMLKGTRPVHVTVNATWPVMGPWITIFWRMYFVVMINGKRVDADFVRAADLNKSFHLVIAAQAFFDSYLKDGTALPIIMKDLVAQLQ
ncbi:MULTISPECIES: hypothetical protein [unclassified Neorhizobium]|uniref:hypothetical protein n=1 Tax=unclassified Neorhizobium TaxID=2629175 RepID=UPI001FF5E6B1|nr:MULTISPECIES: hypothetical protein [unclassified Neorhizobium]MCJ9672162.1 hypothetical protein [Neorhizobium sp. SHOUNA12B]MCJ9748039.1 hypothetical protein [Neorhizobium sp. SHOUNA12A]